MAYSIVLFAEQIYSLEKDQSISLCLPLVSTDRGTSGLPLFILNRKRKCF